MDRNRQTVLSIYEAFGRGDVAAILEYMAPDVAWEYHGGAVAAPWLEPGTGPDHVRSFLQTLNEMVEIRHFQPTRILADGDVVVSLIDLKALVRVTGKAFDEPDEVHVWHFDADGKVAKFRHATNSYGHFVALQPD